MMTPADVKVLERLVGSGTFARGSSYARAGAVRTRTWSPGGTHVVGEIQGGERRPYVATVTLTRSNSKVLSGFQATCTCPVGANCKHAVALVMAELPTVHSDPAPTLTLVRGDSGPSRRTLDDTLSDDSPGLPGRGSRPTDWQLPLQTLLDSEGQGAR